MISFSVARKKSRAGVPAFLLLLGLAVFGPRIVSAAAAFPTLSVPSSERVLQVTIKLPAEARVDPQQRWELVDNGDGPKPIPTQIIPAIALDGSPDQSQRALLASIPPRSGSTNPRQFRFRESTATSQELSFRWSDVSDASLGLWEGTRPVFVYNHGVLSRPDVPADRNRSTYVHPIYGLDGEVLTDDFPKDHYHHRGLFWAWPHVRIEDTNYDLWDIRGIHQRFERWLDRQAGNAAAVLGVQNGWFIGDRKVMQERVWLTVFPATPQGQVIDVNLIWVPTDRSITLAGAEEKSYGGLTLRYAPRTNTVITTPLGNKSEDLTVTRLAWADLSAQFARALQPTGAAIFISPTHPDYPPTWLTRHYGALCVGWPGVTPATFHPGERVHCRSRVWIHRGTPSAADLSSIYSDYQHLGELRWIQPASP